eukprot:jgi/Chlat1/2630/Chrsp178S02470
MAAAVAGVSSSSGAVAAALQPGVSIVERRLKRTRGGCGGLRQQRAAFLHGDALFSSSDPLATASSLAGGRPQVSPQPCGRRGPCSCSASAGFEAFQRRAGEGNVVPLVRRIFSDQLTPVMAYRCLVQEQDREAPSFLLESVVDGDKTGRYSFVGAHPSIEVVAKGNQVTVLDHYKRTRVRSVEDDPMAVPVRLSSALRAVQTGELPQAFSGGWVGFTAYDTVRYVESGKIPFEAAPPDDRDLPDLHLGLYKRVVVFDHVTKVAYLVQWVFTEDFELLEDAYSDGMESLDELAALLQTSPTPDLSSGNVDLVLGQRGDYEHHSTMTREQYMGAVDKAQEHIRAGDIFQVVLSHRFERRTFADPFQIYRALRIVNPSPYMIYMQARGCIMVASSPEILCRVADNIVVNRPLAGTRRRGSTPQEDKRLEEELLADEKECAEHVMLVDLGRNDVGRVAKDGTVKVEALMNVERYSHVMHISSTVTGQLKDGLDCWDVLRAALPAGTISGAPKVRAMQIIDDLEVTRRGPYGGGIGTASFTGGMDMALALRTMVIPTSNADTIYSYNGSHSRREWVVHLQAGAGIVADSNPAAEYEETVNKAAALGRAIDLAETAFTPQGKAQSKMAALNNLDASKHTSQQSEVLLR